MQLGYQTNTWGGVVGHPAGVTSIKDLCYLAPGSTEQALREIAAVGYQGFELFDGNLMAYAGRPAAFRALLRETRLAFVATYCGANFIYPDVWPEELWRITQTVELAAELGARHLVVGGGALRAAGSRDEDYSRLADSLSQVADLALAHGLRASYHPHHGTLVETPEQIARVFGQTAIGFCPDTGHLLEGGGDPAALIRTYGQRVNYVHLKDYGHGDFRPLGQGQVDLWGVLEGLQAIEYDDWITVELDAYAGPPQEAARIAWQFLKQGRPQPN